MERDTRQLLFRLIALAAAWGAVYLMVVGLTTTRGAAGNPMTAEECGRIVVEAGSAPPFHASSTRVLLALDEEWRAFLGADAGPIARALLGQASALFRNAHIHLLPVGVVSWDSPDAADQAQELLSAAETTVDRRSADIVIALTGQALTGADGLARRNGRYAIVEHHPGRRDRDALVLAHEIAHLFGAAHACDAPGGGLMERSGFTGSAALCPCTERVLEANAARFHELLGSEGDPTP